MVAASLVIFAVALGAQSMPKLPDGTQLPKGAESPGQVVFNHSTHVDESNPDCTTCHPKVFRILKSTKVRTPIVHARMEKGELCGMCHDGKKAFALDEDCTFCHTAE
jgi:c(7)-type cytochrome triheme protein